MKTDKEYPATHSMATSWYMVDDDGNVGIMDYEDNGPVPLCTEEIAPDLLLFGYQGDYKPDVLFDLTEEQIMASVEDEPQVPIWKDLWWASVVRIDTGKENRFLELCRNKDISTAICLKKEAGLYYFSAWDCYRNTSEVILKKHSSLQKLLDEHVILEAYKIKDFWFDSEFDEKIADVVHKQNYTSAPYYIYHQAYWRAFPAKRMIVPQHPVKISQVPDSFRHRMHKVKGKFADMETLQIAEHVPCDSYDEDVLYNGCKYELLPSGEQKRVYCLVEILADNFRPYCPYGDDCDQDACNNVFCEWVFKRIGSIAPTVIFVNHPDAGESYEYNQLRDIGVKLPLFRYYPYRKGSSRNYGEWRKNPDLIEKMWTKTHLYFDMQVGRIKPRVFILDENVREIFEKVHPIDNHRVEIGGVSYPVYLDSEVDEYRAEIEKYASMPYRGEKFELVYPEEVMDKFVEEGKAIRLQEKYVVPAPKG